MLSDTLRQALLDLGLALVTTVILPWVLFQLRNKLKLDTTEKQRNTLETALTNAVGLIAKGGSRQEALAYLVRGAGDAIKYFNLNSYELDEKLTAKQGVVEAVAAPVVDMMALDEADTAILNRFADEIRAGGTVPVSK